MSPFPLPVRVAAGLAATAVDQACKLPTQLTGLPVTVVSRALQVSMRVQQQVTELAIRGDEVFALLRPVDDTAPWARFDEDLDEDRVGAEQRNGDARVGTPGRFTPSPPPPPPVPAPRREPGGAGELDEADVARELAPHSSDHGPADGPADHGPAQHGPAHGAPEAMPGYEDMSLPQLRGKLRALSLQQLEDLLAHEQTHQNRPPFVTMLSNRISTLRSR